MSNLEGKVAVVTGASKGIGAGIAESFAAAGASVVVNYASSREGADRVVRDITSKGGKAIAVQGDVSKAEDVKRLFSETKKAFGAIDVLVNNAGVYEFDALEAVTEKEFYFVHNVIPGRYQLPGFIRYRLKAGRPKCCQCRRRARVIFRPTLLKLSIHHSHVISDLRSVTVADRPIVFTPLI